MLGVSENSFFLAPSTGRRTGRRPASALRAARRSLDILVICGHRIGGSYSPGKREEGGEAVSEANKGLARRSWEIVTKGDLDTLDDALQKVYADDIVMHEPDEDVRGIEGIKRFVSMIRSALPDLRVTLEDDIAEGNKVVSRWRAQGTHQGELMGIAPTGNQVAITGITIHRIEEGKIVEEWENWDALGMMQQIGAVPSPEQPTQA
jgi:steroid delta-isomerase-like uncharacterized protein